MEIVVFVLGFGCLMLAGIALLVPLSKRLGLPLPVTVALGGLGIGTLQQLVEYDDESEMMLGLGFGPFRLDSYDEWFLSSLALDSSTILMIFLPPMLFEMALAVNVRRMIDEWATVILLAVFAVAAATGAVGVAVWGAAQLWSDTSLTLIACLMLGAAVATTDPAAVITTFREIGAPRRLVALLEGESLLNDAAAIAIFTVLLGIAAGNGTFGGGAVLIAFVYAFGVGAAIGIAAAWAGARLYPILGGSAAAEVSATVALAYGAYLGAEVALGGSGVVAVVFAGLATGSLGFVRMGPQNWSGVRLVWGQIGFWANNLILLLVALITPGILAALTVNELLLAAVVYVAALLARAAILFGVLNLMERARISEAIEPRQKVLVLWGGVRGAVTLVLALSLADTGALGEDAALAGALAATYALATLVLNAGTLALVTRRLGLDTLSEADLALRDRVVAGSIERVRQVVKNLARRREFEPEALAAVEQALRQARREVAGTRVDARVPFGERLRLGLTIAAAQESRLVRRGFEEGAVDPAVMLRLRLVADRLADAARSNGRQGYEDEAEQALKPTAAFRRALLLHRHLRLERPLARRIEARHAALLELERMLRELERFAEQTLSPMIGADAADNIAELIRWRRDRADEEIEATELQYPKYCAALERALLTRTAIRRERQQFDRLFADSIIGPELHDDLTRELDRREREVARPPQLDLTLTSNALIGRVPLFAGLDDKRQRKLSRRLKVRMLPPGAVVVEAGERDSAMVFVASGALIERGGAERQFATGAYFGVEALGPMPRRRDHAIVALTFSRVLLLTRRDWRRYFAADPAFDRLMHPPEPTSPPGPGGVPATGTKAAE
ncbi:MAG: cation:proton antiporter [Pseudomonadota bacterium]